MQLANWRWSWRSALIVSTLFPTLSTVALGMFASKYASVVPRQVLLNLPDRTSLSIDMAVLVAIMVGFLWLVSQRLDWRQI